MNIAVNGRNVEVPEHYRVHVAEKMAHLERYDDKIIHYEVELFHENNRRQSKLCQRVEITGTGNGPIIRAKARGPDFYAALAAAITKLKTRLRRNHDRRQMHHDRRHPTPVTDTTGTLQPPTISTAPGTATDDGPDTSGSPAKERSPGAWRNPRAARTPSRCCCIRGSPPGRRHGGAGGSVVADSLVR